MDTSNFSKFESQRSQQLQKQVFEYEQKLGSLTVENEQLNQRLLQLQSKYNKLLSDKLNTEKKLDFYDNLKLSDFFSAFDQVKTLMCKMIEGHHLLINSVHPIISVHSSEENLNTIDGSDTSLDTVKRDNTNTKGASEVAENFLSILETFKRELSSCGTKLEQDL